MPMLKWLLGGGAPVGTAAPTPIDPQRSLAQAIFSNGKLPSNFSINLGAAPCNHSCLFCPQSVKKPRKAAWLDLEILRKVAGEMPEQGMLINISSYSETLAAPNLVPAVRLLKEVRPKLKVAMATNGSLYREDVIAGLIDVGLDHYSYSFDAPDRESYKRMMQVDHFDRVWNNLERIVEMRNRRGSAMRITTHIMAFDQFKDNFEAFRAQWTGKVDDVLFRPVGNWGGDSWGLRKNLEAAGFTAPLQQGRAKRSPCNSIFMHFKLQHDGRYAPCIAAVPDYLPDEEVHAVAYLGSARDMTWGEAWAKLGEMRRAHLEGNWDAYECCRTCDVWSLWPEIWEDRGTTTAEGHRFHIPGVEHAGP